MNERAHRFFISQMLTYALAAGPERLIAGRKMRAGEICCSCKSPLPQPRTPERKRCVSCLSKRHVYMSFFRFFGWHCRFTEEGRIQLPKRLTFKDSTKIYETAKRANGLTVDADRQGLDLAIDIGRGGIWLRLTDQQYEALGGLPAQQPASTIVGRQLDADADNDGKVDEH